MRTPVIAGNWKMYLTPAEGKAMVQELQTLTAGVTGREIVLCPPFVTLPAVAEAAQESAIGIGGQNMHPANEGAFTGEIAAPMLRACGCTYVILGHSERRQYFGETDAAVAAKTKAALAGQLVPIVCVGETLDEREQGITQAVIEIQLRRALGGLTAAELTGVIVAYEPVWAIGTGRTASPADAQDVCAFIRTVLAALQAEAAPKVRILYGGSVKPDNIRELMAQSDIDGALVGGASLQAASFAKIVRFEEQ
ncbi:triose-phosphate isomerase [Heliophilum fasciatum]|uniref:Triosephosphate isomerase n=1 Tax=Heliophilum fasciatum TaxID=35700 RepID=A0A4R2RHB2_9FIRM|nr:triose-phosphate isomerase [Heliophilum fasciatum]MCW2279053.1 triosephosphate isomerase [Heliophilum fasciatum]TCP61517.1 triosephosphate isomerase [Heliophilum fasciatum]